MTTFLVLVSILIAAFVAYNILGNPETKQPSTPVAPVDPVEFEEPIETVKEVEVAEETTPKPRRTRKKKED
jgi:hypothetical protein